MQENERSTKLNSGRNVVPHNKVMLLQSHVYNLSVFNNLVFISSSTSERYSSHYETSKKSHPRCEKNR